MAAGEKSGLTKVSAFLGAFRFAFMPLGLFALVAVGVHAAADFVDDRFLQLVHGLDVVFDGFFGQFELTAKWVDWIGTREQTLIARAVTLVWELAVDLFIALPVLGYGEEDKDKPGGRARFAIFEEETWKTLLKRVNREPTLMRVARPIVTAIFVIGGAYAVSRLVESTLFVGLQGDLAPVNIAGPLARGAGGLSFILVLFSLGWRAVLRALEHADATCRELAKTSKKRAALAGLWGTALSLPLALALLLEARALLSVFL